MAGMAFGPSDLSANGAAPSQPGANAPGQRRKNTKRAVGPTYHPRRKNRAFSPLACRRTCSLGAAILLVHSEFFAIVRPMTETQRQILEALLELERAVASMPTANPKPNLLALFSRIDSLTSSLPTSTDPNLLHYLHKRSYQKARIHLEGHDAENQAGNCRHV